MDLETNEDTPHRIALACRNCNRKKVKCNAPGGFPCSACRSKGVECVPIQSGRGKYPRHSARRGARKSRDDRRSRGQSDQPPFDLSAVQHTDVAGSASAQEIVVDGDSSHATRDPNLFAQVAEQRISSVQRPITKSARTVFLGEAFSLTYVINDVLAPFLSATPNFQRRLHFPIAEHTTDAVRSRKRKLSHDQRETLQKRGIYYELPAIQKRNFLDLYFEWFNPAFPVLDHADFLWQSEAGELSLLVENVVLMIAVTICTAEDLAATNLPNRYAAREVFYQQARLLFDSDLDVDKLDLIIGALLLSFWWGGPDEQKDTWYWIGIATSLAQSLGMHRSTLKSGMDIDTTRKWRRIWWSIRMREALVSGSIGRPLHFSERDCDVEMLQPEDIDVLDVHAHYACQMAQLCEILTKVITTRYAAGYSSTLEDMTEVGEKLLAFRQNVPALLQYTYVDCTSQRGLWSAMLAMAINYTTILLCRPSRSIGNVHRTEAWGDSIQAQSAANETTRIVEDLLMSGMCRLCQIHAIPSTVNSLAIHLLVMCTSRTVDRALAENRIRICMLGLNSLQECWPVGSWVYLMFKTVVKKLQSKFHVEESSLVPSSIDVPRRQQQPQRQPLPVRGSGDGDMPSMMDHADSGPAYNQMDIEGDIRHTNFPSNRDAYSGFPLTDTFGEDYTFLQSLFDLDPFQAHHYDLERFFEQLDMPT